MHRSVTVSEELFTEFRKNWVEWYNAEMPDCDENLKDLIVKFNKLEGVVTRFCCDGHPDSNEGNSFYICMVCTQEGLENIYKVYSEVIDNLSHELDITYSLQIEISQLQAMEGIRHSDSSPIIPSVTLRAYPDIEEQRILIDRLTTAVEVLLSNPLNGV